MIASPLKCLLNILTCLAFWCCVVPAQGQYTDTSRVAIQDLTDYIEMENGFLGVRIPKSSLFNSNAPDYVPAPISCVVYRDESLSNDFPNYLDSPTPAISMTTTVLQETNDTCKIKVSYTFNKPELNDGTNVWEAAGPGYYDVTLTMVVGEKACMVLEESDFEVGYSVKVSDGLSPDRGRYVGHHSTSIADGYDVNNQLYVKNDVIGWNAEVELGFDAPKDFEPLTNWGPWGVNTGWNWQLYNAAAPNTANTFGIFHGRPSKILGVGESGVKIWTAPTAISDLHASCDEYGNCHYIWLTEDELWYKSMDTIGTWSTEIQVASGLINPFVFAEGTTVNILAMDPLAAPADQLKLYKKIGSGSWNNYTIAIDATVDDPFVYGASNGTDDFIFVKGTRSGATGIFMYSAAFNTTTFSFADDLPNGAAFRSSNRPDVKKEPGGNIVIVFSQDNLYQSYNVVLDGTTTFASTDLYPFGTDVTFGMTVDPRTGDFFFLKQSGFSSNYVEVNGSGLGNQYSTGFNAFAANHAGFELPNRRSIATDDNGNALVRHNGYLGVSYFYYFDNSTDTWTDVTNSTWQEIEHSHVHFNSTTGLFYIVGKYQGELARFSYNGSGNPVFMESFGSTVRQSAGLEVFHNRLTANASYYPDIRFEWGIFAGKKSLDLDVLDTVQAISRTQNRLSGLANRIENYQNAPAIFSAEFLSGGLYITPAEVQAIITKVKTDNDFYTQMWQLDAGYKVVMDAWRDPTTSTTNQVYQDIVDYANGLISELKTGDGIYSFHYLYSQGANDMRRFTTYTSGLLADNRLTVPQQDTLKKKAALFARVLWDDDFVPYQAGTGVGLGTSNMQTSYQAYRWFFAMLLKDDPEFSARATAVPAELHALLSTNLNGVGAPLNNAHYLQPALDGLIFSALQLKNLGISDEFAQNDTLRMFSDFLFFLQTPKSVRFADNRKMICFGDGTEESATIFGLLGTGYSGVNENLSKQLMYAYRNGAPRGSDFGPVVIAINHELPDTSEQLMHSGHFPGYMSTFRTAIDTDQETATWLLDGDWLVDHRNDDRGSMFMYALGAPLSLSYGNFYNPYISGGHMKNIIVPETQFPEWNNTSYQPFLLPQTQSWFTSDNEAYLAFENSAGAHVMMDRLGTKWERKLYQFHANSSTPIFVVKDSLNDAINNFIWSMNFSSDGTVSTPGGDVDPPERKWDYQYGPNEYPAASSQVSLSAGGFHRFDFTGINWQTHPAGGIDWELYTAPTTAQEATLSEWAHTFIPNPEGQEFLATNGSAFEERQQILRIQGKEKFYNVIVPYAKGFRPNNLSVTKSVDTLTVTCDDFTFKTDLNFSIYNDTNKDVLTTYRNQALSAANSMIEGAAMELEIFTDTIYARLHGETGVREVTLPSGSWVLSPAKPNANFNTGTGKWELNLPTVDSLHNSFRGGFDEFSFVNGGSVVVSPKLFLQGPYDSGLMDDDLRASNLIPLTEPYSELTEFTHISPGGGESTYPSVLSVTGNDAIVDWVFVELRDKIDPSIVSATRSALLQRDGDIVDVDGVSPLSFPTISADDYYVAIRHRNHLGVMTASVSSLTSTTTAIDFSDPATSTYGTNARVDLGSNVMGLWAADINSSGVVDAGDRSAAWNGRNLLGYLRSDATLNGVTDAGDRSITWNNRNLAAQLP